MTKYKITLSPTADGLSDYLQILSDDGFKTNIVLVGQFAVTDSRGRFHQPAKIHGERIVKEE